MNDRARRVKPSARTSRPKRKRPQSSRPKGDAVRVCIEWAAAELCRHSEGTAQRYVGDAFRRYLDGDVSSLDDALGLRPQTDRARSEYDRSVAIAKELIRDTPEGDALIKQFMLDMSRKHGLSTSQLYRIKQRYGEVAEWALLVDRTYSPPNS